MMSSVIVLPLKNNQQLTQRLLPRIIGRAIIALAIFAFTTITFWSTSLQSYRKLAQPGNVRVILKPSVESNSTHSFSILEVSSTAYLATNNGTSSASSHEIVDDAHPKQDDNVHHPKVVGGGIQDNNLNNNNNNVDNIDNVDPILWPIIQSGRKMYILNRRDRSGRVVAEMLYAHAFAFANNLTYAGTCWAQKGQHDQEVFDLLHALNWTKVLPIACPDGIENKTKTFNFRNGNVTELSPLILGADVFKIHSNFNPAWRAKIRGELMEHNEDIAADRADGTLKPYEIAVQIRRGDISPCRVRYLPNSHFLSLIDQYTPTEQELNGRTVHVTIFSESDSFEPFDEFLERGYSVELDSPNLVDVWIPLATADVIILSRSFFPMIPAMLNPNIVVSTFLSSFRPLEGWNVVDDALTARSESEAGELRNQCRNATAP
jgi:hypothetical protein